MADDPTPPEEGDLPPPSDDDVVDAEIVGNDDDILGVEGSSVPDDASELLNDDGELVDFDPADIDIPALLDERNQFLDAYRRSQADFENYRKQAQKRQTDEVNRVLGRFVDGLLPVLDAGDAAIAHGADGATEVFTALLGALEKEGLQRVDPLGEPFDPNVAEAVMHEPGEGGEQVVAEVLRVGYLWNERVLRPAMVKVKD